MLHVIKGANIVHSIQTYRVWEIDTCINAIMRTITIQQNLKENANFLYTIGLLWKLDTDNYSSNICQLPVTVTARHWLKQN